MHYYRATGNHSYNRHDFDFFLKKFWESKFGYFMRIICLADESHEMSSLIFSEKITKAIFNCLLHRLFGPFRNKSVSCQVDQAVGILIVLPRWGFSSDTPLFCSLVFNVPISNMTFSLTAILQTAIIKLDMCPKYTNAPILCSLHIWQQLFSKCSVWPVLHSDP